MIYLKLHETENGAMVAMCDQSLIGKTLSEGDLFIDLRAYASFYKGELVSKEKAREIIDSKKIHSANIVGKESVDAAVALGILDRAAVLMVQDVPYGHAYSVEARNSE